MSVLRVTTFRGLGVGDWSFYPGSAQQLVAKPVEAQMLRIKSVCACRPSADEGTPHCE